MDHTGGSDGGVAFGAGERAAEAAGAKEVRMIQLSLDREHR
jgi:hypothetical protein